MPLHPDRVRPLQGATNFRDLGGYPTRHGRVLRWRRLFRSDHLAGLTAEDAQQLQQLDVRRAFDFRGEQERAAQPYALPGVRAVPLSIEPSVTQRMDAVIEAGRQLTPEITAELMRDLYRRLVREHQHRFAELFRHLLDDDGALVFHCTAGKDRTGVAAALILQALDVPRDLVQEDFMLTNAVFRHPPMPPSDIPPEVLAVLWSVRGDYLDAAWQVIDQEFGGVDAYLERQLGLSAAARRALQDRYLEDAR